MKKLHFIAALLLCHCAFAQNWMYLPGTTDYPIFKFYNDTVSGKLLAIGSFDTAGTVRAPGIAAWDGSSWSALGLPALSSGPFISSVTRFNGDLYMGGGFPSWNNSESYLSRWNGTTLDSIGRFTVGGASGLLVYNDSLIIYDNFSIDTVNGVPFNSVVSWDGTNWTDLGHGALEGSVFDMVVYRGELYCSTFSSTDHLFYVFRYFNNTWQAIGSNFSANVADLCVYNNELYAGGAHYTSNAPNAILKLDTLNNTWVTPGGGVASASIAPYSSIDRMCVYNSCLYATGVFDHAGGVPAVVIAKWDGAQWCGLGVDYNTSNVPNCIAYNSDLYLSTANTFDNTPSNGFVKWIGGSFVDTCGFISGVNEEVQASLHVIVFPNPASTQATFLLSGFDGNKTLIIYDQLGKEIWRKETEENQIEFLTEGFAAGLYYYRIEQELDLKATGKLIIQ